MAGLIQTGCASRAVSIDNPIEVQTAEYDRVYEASVEVLRDYRFRLARQDRRFGRITTEPMTAASSLEPWHKDAVTKAQTDENTLNHQRRTVSVFIEPEGETDRYRLRVVAEWQRRQHPPQLLHTAAFAHARYGRHGAGARTVTTESGERRSFWRPMGRDADLEQRLVYDILVRANLIDPRHETEAGQPLTPGGTETLIERPADDHDTDPPAE